MRRQRSLAWLRPGFAFGHLDRISDMIASERCGWRASCEFSLRDRRYCCQLIHSHRGMTQERQGGEPHIMTLQRQSGELQRTLRSEDQDGLVEVAGRTGALWERGVVLDIKHRLNRDCRWISYCRKCLEKEPTFATTFTQQSRATCWLLAAPHNGTLVGGKPNPSLVSDTSAGNVGGYFVCILPELPSLLRVRHAE